MLISNYAEFVSHPITGATQPSIFWGTVLPDTNSTFTNKAVGSEYTFQRATGVVEKWVKIANNSLASDWSCKEGTLTEKFTRAAMTDGGATVGTIILTAQLPIGAIAMASAVRDITGFIGDTSAAMTIGDGSDVDRYNTSTYNLFTTASLPASLTTQNAPSGNRGHTSAQAVTVTITSTADFTNVSAGAATIQIYYLI